jgi:hypothetical protein
MEAVGRRVDVCAGWRQPLAGIGSRGDGPQARRPLRVARGFVARDLIAVGAGGICPPPGWNGAIAQLGERLNGIQEVSGSIPLGSTSL